MKISIDDAKKFAFNDASYKNGEKLYKGNKYVKLNISKEQDLIYGECQGSGKKNYYCSVDYVDESNPIPRCSCPSRQIPCKHVSGLMIAYAENKEGFEEFEIPEDIISKRGKLEKRAVNAAKKSEPKELTEKDIQKLEAKKLKRIDNQLVGIDNAFLLYKEIVINGLNALDASSIKALQGKAEGLGSYHIDGVKNAFLELFNVMANDDENFTNSINKLVYINALITKAKKYLTDKKENPLYKETENRIEEQLGHIWNYNEINDLGLCEDNVSLVELAFVINDNKDFKIVTETSVNININSGELVRVENIIPYRAKKYIKQSDSTNKCIEVTNLSKYPGENAKRVSYKECTFRDMTSDDYNKILSHSNSDYDQVIKNVKDCFKTPLSVSKLYYLVNVDDVKQTSTNIVICCNDKQIVVTNTNSNCIKYLNTICKDSAMLIEFEKQSNTIDVNILSIIKDNTVLRLV